MKVSSRSDENDDEYFIIRAEHLRRFHLENRTLSSHDGVYYL